MTFAIPGSQAAVSSSAREILWGGDESRIEVLRDDAVIDSAAVDAGNTPTTVLRAGMILGTVDSDSELSDYDADATDGTQNIAGILGFELDMKDQFGSVENKFAPVIVRAPVRASRLLIGGSALVGHADEYITRRKLAAQGFLLDDDKQNFLSGLNWRQQTKITDYTVVAADNATLFQATTADATFTLPAIKVGLVFEFLRLSDHELVVASVAGDDMIVGNDLSADSVTFTTASEHIGARIRVEAIYVGSTPKWLVTLPQPPFGTAAGSAMTISIAT